MDSSEIVVCRPGSSASKHLKSSVHELRNVVEHIPVKVIATTELIAATMEETIKHILDKMEHYDIDQMPVSADREKEYDHYVLKKDLQNLPVKEDDPSNPLFV